MTWFKVDDGLFANPKWVACSVAARALWVTAGSWAGKQEDSGKVPRHLLAFLGGRPRDAAELVANGLWDVDGDGWCFHNWFEFQPSPEQIQQKRDAAAERQRKWRESQRESRRDSNATNGVGHAPPDPSRPDPVPDPVDHPQSSSSSEYPEFEFEDDDDEDWREAKGRCQDYVRAGGVVDKPTPFLLKTLNNLRDDGWVPPLEPVVCNDPACDNGWLPSGNDVIACANCRPWVIDQQMAEYLQ